MGDPPKWLRCEITGDLMSDPVIINFSPAHPTVERTTVEDWFASGSADCPVTGERLEDFTLVPNHAICDAIHAWKEEHGLVRGEVERDPDEGEDLSTKEDEDLCMAAQRGDLESVKRLLDTGSDVDMKNKVDWTPLTIASWYGHQDIVEALITSGASLEAQDIGGWRPLFAATAMGHLSVVRTLLAAGAQPNAKNILGSTPLQWASQDDQPEIVRALLAAGADIIVDAAGRRQPTSTSHGGSANVIQEAGLASIKPTLSSKSDDFRMLRQRSDEVTGRVGEPLEQIQAILPRTRSLERQKIISVVAPGPLPTARSLTKVNSRLAKASKHGKLKEVKSLVARGADLEARNQYGRTSLYLAALRGHTQVVNYLIRNNADVDAADNYGRTPLIAASSFGHLASVRALIDAGGNVNAQDCDGWTALFEASRRGRLDTVAELIASGANVNLASMDRRTPLDVAATGVMADRTLLPAITSALKAAGARSR